MQQPKKEYNQEKTKELQYHLSWLTRQGDIGEHRMQEAAQEIICLVKQGADPNAESTLCNLLALDWAATRGFGDTVRLLLNYGANPNLQNDASLFSAIEFQRTSVETKKKVVRLLLENGADPNKIRKCKIIYSTDPHTETPLLLAFKCSSDLCHLLFEYGADWNVIPENHRRWMLDKLP